MSCLFDFICKHWSYSIFWISRNWKRFLFRIYSLFSDNFFVHGSVCTCSPLEIRVLLELSVICRHVTHSTAQFVNMLVGFVNTMTTTILILSGILQNIFMNWQRPLLCVCVWCKRISYFSMTPSPLTFLPRFIQLLCE